MSESGSCPSLKLYLLGPPQLERDGAPVHIGTRKAVALLAYLAVTRQAHSREALATLFWSEYDQARAYANLRRTLWILNQVLGREALDADADTISLRCEGQLWLDAAVFRDLLAECRTHGHTESEVCPACLPLLTGAVELYRDHFTAGFTLPDSPGFDEWQFFEGEGLRRELAGALERLVRWHAARHEFGKAISFARRWLALDPLQESVHRELMLLYAWDGQWAAALRQYGECTAVLKEELEAAPDEETTRLYHAIRAKQLPPMPADAAPAPDVTGAEPRVNLPPQPTPFVGRQAELAEIATLLSDPECRLLTLAGPGGAGKTRLAIQAARQVLSGQAGQNPFLSGVYFVPLAAVSEVYYIVPAIADAVGFSFFRREGEEPRHQLFNYLREKRMLLILDTLEHLVEGAGLLSDLLEQAPGVKVVVTSRERLNSRWEWVFPVEGLEFPSHNEAALESYDQYGAVQLFVQRARQATAAFAPSGEDMADIARICQRLEGLPLGIELAATWTRTLSCRDIADEIGRDLDFLSTSIRDIPQRQRSLRAVFDHSWELLSEGERQVLTRLSLFTGKFDRQAAEQVAGADIRLLSALVDKSLLARPQSGRYGLHDVVCEFAASRLAAEPQEQIATRDRHCAYYAAYLERMEQDLTGRRQVAALDEIGGEIENCRAAWQWAAERCKWQELRRAAGTLQAFYSNRTRFLEGEHAFAQAAGALEALTNESDAGNEATAGEIKRTLGLMLAYQALFALHLYRQEEAADAIQRSLALLKRWGVAEDVAWANVLAVEVTGWEMGPKAESVLLESLDTLLPADRPYLVGYLYTQLTALGRVLKDPSHARRLIQKGLDFHTSQGDHSGMAFAEFSLGSFAQEDGALVEALQHFRKSLELRRELGDIWGISLCLDWMGYVARELGEWREARQLHRESLAASREIGDPLGIAGSWDNLGLVEYDEGNYGEAERCFQEGLAVRRQVGHAWEIAVSLSHMGDTALARGEYEAAAGRYLESIATFRTSGNRNWIFIGLFGLARCCLAQGRFEKARRHLRTVLHAVATARDSLSRLRTLVEVADLLTHTDREERAAEVLIAILHHPAGTGARRARVEQLLNELALRLPPDTIPALEGRAPDVDLDHLMASLMKEI